MLCIEALKLTSSATPLYFDGKTYHVERNNRMALLGDRLLTLALCDTWFQTGNPAVNYNTMQRNSENRKVLLKKGKALGIRENLVWYDQRTSKPDARLDADNAFSEAIPEAVEAILGAVWLDSGKSIETVKEVINKAALDTHEQLKVDVQSQDMHKKKELSRFRVFEHIVSRKRKKGSKRLRIEYETEQNELRIDREKSRNLKEEAQPESHNPALRPKLTHFLKRSLGAMVARWSSVESINTEESKMNPCAIAAASRLSKERNMLNDKSGHDYLTTDSGRQLSSISRKEDEEKVDTLCESGDQDPQTSSHAKKAGRRAKGQSQQIDAMSTGLNTGDQRRKETLWLRALGMQGMLKMRGIDIDVWNLYQNMTVSARQNSKARDRVWSPVEEWRGLHREHRRINLKSRLRAVAIRHMLKTRGIDIDVESLYQDVKFISMRNLKSLTVEEARSIQENSVPVWKIIGQEKFSTKIKSASPTLESRSNGTITSPIPVSGQKLSSSPEQPSPTKRVRSASEIREKTLQELSRHLENTGFESASAVNSRDENKKMKLRTKDVEQLERDILSSHKDIWQANGTADSSWKPTKRSYDRIANIQLSRDYQILAERLARRTPTTREATNEEDARLRNSLQEDLLEADINYRPFVQLESDKSATEVPSTPATPATPRPGPRRKLTLYTPSIRRQMVLSALSPRAY
ncbi:unnamed protein product [Alternaria burnsii]|nr:unnamed protein product [Alternaria burnsii]